MCERSDRCGHDHCLDDRHHWLRIKATCYGGLTDRAERDELARLDRMMAADLRASRAMLDTAGQ